MLIKWGLTNFKSIENAEIDLTSLTVLTGTNSSGKSSLLQSMLIVAQTLQNRFLRRSLVLNGPIFEAGKFEQILSFSNNSDKMKIKFHFTSNKSKINNIQYSAEFKLPGKHDKINIDSFSPALTKINLSIKEIDNNCHEIIAENINNDLVVTQMSHSVEKHFQNSIQELIYNLFNPWLDKEITRELRLPNIDLLNNTRDDITSEIKEKHFDKKYYDEGLVDQLVGQSLKSIEDVFANKVRMFFKRDMSNQVSKVFNIGKIQKKIVLNHFLAEKFSISFVNPKEIISTSKPVFNESDDCDKEIIIEPILNASKILTEHFVHSFKYLGPLRFHANISPFSKANDQRDVGITGEYTAAVYDSFRNIEIRYISPKYFESENKHELSDDIIISKSLFPHALNEWINFLDISKGVDVLPTEDGYKIKVIYKDQNNSVNMIHVGTGVSQVLPILVMCLLAEKDSTLLFEQPELHLHPAVQSKLADFFLSMALLGKQCIIETHSEYLITELRYRISNALLHNDTTIQNLVKIYFATKTDGKSQFNEIKVTKFGGISEWPEGFFDERQKIDDKMLDSMGVEFGSDDD
jgi:predicted ATPase